MKLEKRNNATFDEYFEGTNGNKTVKCVLDDYCVRYVIIKNGKCTARHEFKNSEKEKCFKNAERALNR